MDFLDFNPQSIGKSNYRAAHNIYLSQNHQTQITPLIQIWYKTPSRLKLKSWKLVIQWHGNAIFSHMILLDFDPKRIWKLNLRVINHIFFSKNHPNNIISLIQISYKTTSRLKPNPWRLVIQGHEYARFSYMYLWDFDLHSMCK